MAPFRACRFKNTCSEPSDNRSGRFGGGRTSVPILLQCSSYSRLRPINKMGICCSRVRDQNHICSRWVPPPVYQAFRNTDMHTTPSFRLPWTRSLGSTRQEQHTLFSIAQSKTAHTIYYCLSFRAKRIRELLKPSRLWTIFQQLPIQTFTN